MREIPLAQRFQVSRGPIRDALLQLTQEGLLQAQPNRGARVSREWGDDLRPKMMKMRLELECWAVRRCMTRKEPPLDLTPFKKNLRHFRIACEDNDLPSVVQLDMAFHRLFLQACGDPGLESVWLPIMGGMRLLYSRHKTLLESYEEHRRIIEAVETGKVTAAISALESNIH